MGGGVNLERRLVGVALVRRDRALLDRLRLEWFVADGRVRAVVRDLQAIAGAPDWIAAARLVRERGGDPFMLDDVADALQQRTDHDVDVLVRELEQRAVGVATMLLVTREVDALARHEQLARALEEVAP